MNLPIGSYTMTFTHDRLRDAEDSFDHGSGEPHRDRKRRAQGRRGEHDGHGAKKRRCVNAVDTTNGYVLDKAQLEAIPLPTGSFTGVAILSPGVNAELSSGTGANQRSWVTSRSGPTANATPATRFLLNGVDASNLFNGKSTSSGGFGPHREQHRSRGRAAAPRQKSFRARRRLIWPSGRRLPTPAPETIQEFRVNTSMYDAQQGSTSGAHIDMSTASGTNDIHGQLYVHRGTDWINAAPYFYNQDPNIPDDEKVPELHRYTAGGTLGGPIIKNKLFGFRLAISTFTPPTWKSALRARRCPFGLTNDRSPDGAGRYRADGFRNYCNARSIGTATVATSTRYRIRTAELQAAERPVPDSIANPAFTPTLNFPENVFITQPAYFISDQAVADLDFIATSKDTLALKYYYQHDPTSRTVRLLLR